MSEPASTRPMICRNCGASLTLEGIDERLGVVTCQHCGGVHELTRAVPDARSRETGAAADRRSVRERREVALPARFDIDRRNGALQVSWPRGRKRGAIALGGFSVLWLTLSVSTGLLPLIAVAPALGYFALVRGVNVRHLRIDREALVVREGPLPWPGALRMRSDQIAQLFAVEKLSTLRTGENGRERIQTTRRYGLRAKLHDGKRRTVLGGLGDIEQALWLEREAERLLGLRDEPVPGEYRR